MLRQNLIRGLDSKTAHEGVAPRSLTLGLCLLLLLLSLLCLLLLLGPPRKLGGAIVSFQGYVSRCDGGRNASDR